MANRNKDVHVKAEIYKPPSLLQVILKKNKKITRQQQNMKPWEIQSAVNCCSFTGAGLEAAGEPAFTVKVKETEEEQQLQLRVHN